MKKLIAFSVIAVFAMFSVRAVVSAAEHAAVGSEKCAKMCHKVEFQSWAASKHATAKDKVECETCHGNGADYMKMSVMKDPAKAKGAGLIAKPAMATCTAKCHKPADIKPDMLAKVHEHKAK
jgi:hypothetical protein